MYYEKEVDGKNYYLFYYGEHNGRAERHHTPPHFHDALELLIITEGEADVSVNGECRRLCAGEAVFLTSYDIHSFTFEGCKRYSLVFSRDFCGKLSGEGALPCFHRLPDEKFRKIAEYLSEYYGEYGDRIPNGLLLEALVSKILGELEAASGRVERRRVAGRLIMNALEYIGESFREELSLASVASYLGYSPSYFSAEFNRTVGMSFNGYLNYLRYTYAARLIEQGEHSVTEAAMSAGFGSMKTFYRARAEFENTEKRKI